MGLQYKGESMGIKKTYLQLKTDYFVYVFSNIDQRGNRINNGKEVMMIEITKLEGKLKAQCTQARERYQINSIPQF